MVWKAYIPSLVAFGDVVPNGTKMVPNLVWLIFSLFFTPFSCNIFWLDQHRKSFISKSVDFSILNDNGYKITDASDILYNYCFNFITKKWSPYNENLMYQKLWIDLWISKWHNSFLPSLIQYSLYSLVIINAWEQSCFLKPNWHL